ncbi:MAG: putative signal transduction protein with EFhand domain [Caulobacter sp.]|nr:putative signal transduction protein with EFhand domain [Caulobacter sp.]
MSLSSVSGSSLMQQLQQAMFKSADVNNDGQLSSDEFSAIGQDLQGGGKNSQVSTTLSAPSPAQNFSSDMLSSLLSAQHDSHAEKMFASADANGDGQVTAEELTADLTAHAPKDASGAPPASDVAAAMIKDGDTNGDGSLSLDEMKTMKPHGGHHGGHGGAPPAEASSSSSSSSSASYDPADANKDGTVSSSELIASLQTASSGSGAQATASSSFNLLAQLLSKLTAATTTAASQAATVTA